MCKAIDHRMRRMSEKLGTSEGPGRQGGFTLLALLFLVAILGVEMAALGKVWETASRREKEAQLLSVGDQYRRALISFYLATPGQTKHFPKNLKDLLQDPRFPHTVRHLRRLYHDPVTNSEEWGLVRQDGEIMGIYSLSSAIPLKTANFSQPYGIFEGAVNYRGWLFVVSMDDLKKASGDAAIAQGQEPAPYVPPKDPGKECNQLRQAAERACSGFPQASHDSAYQACIAGVTNSYIRCMSGN